MVEEDGAAVCDGKLRHYCVHVINFYINYPLFTSAFPLISEYITRALQ